MKNSLRIHKWTHNEFNIFILGVLTHPLFLFHPIIRFAVAGLVPATALQKYYW